MTENLRTTGTAENRPTRRTKPKSSVLPAGFNWLNVPIPSGVLNHVHNQARLSNMSLKNYLACFLAEARPVEESDRPVGRPS